VCRQSSVLLVANASQALDARSIDLGVIPSTVHSARCCHVLRVQEAQRSLRHGFTWPHADLLAQLRPQQAYWLAMRVGRGLDQMRETALRNDLGVRAFDVFFPGSLRSRCRGPPGHLRGREHPEHGEVVWRVTLDTTYAVLILDGLIAFGPPRRLRRSTARVHSSRRIGGTG